MRTLPRTSLSQQRRVILACERVVHVTHTTRVRLQSAVVCFLMTCVVAGTVNAQSAPAVTKFAQLGQTLPTPNVYRNAAGAPGHGYWQQRADYVVKAELDTENRRITASEAITYTNNSPDTLPYLWLQLDQNRFRRDSLEARSRTGAKAEDGISDQLSFQALRRHQSIRDTDYGFQIRKIAGANGTRLAHEIVGTMLRVDLPTPLAPGEQQTLAVEWAYNIVDEPAVGGRAGFEHFRKTDTYIYFLAQWFPRMVAYTDYAAWQHHQFLGRGEFTLEFGDYDVALTVPSDHIVSATGKLTNPTDVLSATQRERLSSARRTTEKSTFIVTPDEALANERAKPSTSKQTWRFRAENVRDFAWASSRKFIWDAMLHRQNDGDVKEVLAMSFYPNEAEPIWSQYSTQAVVHTLEVYSKMSFPYPYPTAQSVNTWERGGMEYPMITFNGYRPEPIEAEASSKDGEKGVGSQADTTETGADSTSGKDPDSSAVAGGDGAHTKDGVMGAASAVNEERAPAGGSAPTIEQTYSRQTKHSLIGVIIHEIGHIYFPMTVNSDERQWTWMDEGINSFLEYVASVEWEENFFAYEDELSILDLIGSYMTSENQVPVMTQSDSILQFGPNAYTKPAAALVVLRETVLGRKLFDHAFKEYSRRWRFKRPTPADFFRTMEDASGTDLDWFWQGWFYSTDHVDVNLTAVREYRLASGDPDIDLSAQKALDQADHPEPIEQLRNRNQGIVPRIQRIPGLRDFYNENDKYTPSNEERNDYQEYLKNLEPWERDVLAQGLKDKEYLYFLDFTNEGGLLTPLPLQLTYADGSQERLNVPAEVWRRNTDQVTKLLIRPKQLVAVELDPLHQTADADRSDNHYPRKIQKSRLELFKWPDETRDLMKGMMADLKATQDNSNAAPIKN